MGGPGRGARPGPSGGRVGGRDGLRADADAGRMGTGERRARHAHRQAHQARLDAGGCGIPARAVEADGKDRHRGRRDARRPRMVRTHRHSGRRHLLKAVHRLDPGARRLRADKEKARDGTSGGVVIGGERLAIREWAERTGIPANVISNRLNRGWTPERAVGTPARKRRGPDLEEITVGGETLTVHGWAERTGIPVVTISSRLNCGWTPERAVGTPVRPRRDA